MEFFVYTLVAFLFSRASQVLKLNPTTKHVILQNQVAAETSKFSLVGPKFLNFISVLCARKLSPSLE
jgi:hypothetical protein